MKTILLLMSINFCFLNSNSQDTGFIPPQFKGGDKAFHKYLDNTLKYPHKELENYVLGKAVAKIYIDRMGKVTDVKVTGDNENFNTAVKNVLAAMPEWIPGKVNNDEVDTLIYKTFYFSIDFTHIKNDSTVYECKFHRNVFSKDEAVIRQVRANALWRNGLYEFEGKDYGFAVDFFNRAEENGLNDNNLYYYRGIAHYNSGNKESACIDWQKAVSQGDVEANELLQSKCK